ncbi:MAG TPA: glycosyl transferase, partial [Deltaproteobacteria bacterium]|nr:glycosyl transferase [Deltaproteobacteria bacterium]
QRITDSQAGFRVLRADLARALALQSREYEFETEVLAKILRRGLRVVEVPVTRYPRAAGRTDFRRVHNGLRILKMILKERVRPVPTV